MNRPNHPRTQFGTKLVRELERQNLTNRGLAKKIWPHDPEGMRRSIARWLAPVDGPNVVEPNEASRRSVEDALGLELGALADDPEDEESVFVRALAAMLERSLNRKVEDVVARVLARESA